MEQNTTPTYDADAFKEFFSTHQNDATVQDDVATTSAADNNTEVMTNADESSAATNTDDAGAATTTPDDGASEADDSSDNNSTPPASNTSTADARQKQQNKAFAQMRTQNQQMQNVLKQIATHLGVQNTDDTNAVVEALQTLTLKAQAQKTGVPEEILQKIQTLEARDAENTRRANLVAAGQGFQQLKNQHGLSDADLQSFADELIADGINPYQQPVNLLTEYRNRHFDALIEQAVQKGIQQEAARAAKASRQSTTPQATNSRAVDAPDERINTVADLTNWLEKNAKK